MNIPAFHRMKHPNCIIIKDVVINFNRVCILVKSDKQAFVFGVRAAFKTTVIFSGIRLSFG
jgi:hypothetical protein